MCKLAINGGEKTTTIQWPKLAAWAIDKPSPRTIMPFPRRRGAGLYAVPPGELDELPED